MSKKLSFVLVLFVLFSCTKEKVIFPTNNLQEYLNQNSGLVSDEVIACAASNEFDNSVSYIFYYPIPTATEILYFETEDTTVDPNDLTQYTKRELPKEGVFNGYLGRFVRNDTKEVWSIVTYKTNGKLHKSNPIRLKHQSKATEYTTTVAIEFTQNTSPKFTWQDGTYTDTVIYFQVITNNENNLLSGTYTYDQWFQYYQLNNVVLNVTRNTPPDLEVANTYNFVMMGVSLDNWVNLVIIKDFIVP
jgi:hypothetical protein